MNWYKIAQEDQHIASLLRNHHRAQEARNKASDMANAAKKEYDKIHFKTMIEKDPVILDKMNKQLENAQGKFYYALKIVKTTTKELIQLNRQLSILDPDYETENIYPDESQMDTIALPDGSEISVPNPYIDQPSLKEGLIGDLPAYGFDVMDEEEKAQIRDLKRK